MLTSHHANRTGHQTHRRRKINTLQPPHDREAIGERAALITDRPAGIVHIIERAEAITAAALRARLMPAA
jgi:hypothetical protein